jgi:predicted MFS family arabinose efflux permease
MVVVAGGSGVLLAAVLTPAATQRVPGRVYVSLLLGSTALILLAVVPPFQAPLLLLGVFLLNIASQGTKIVVDTTLQHECDDTFRGRVFSINDTAFNVTFVAGLFAAATLLPADGRSPAAVVLIAIGYGALAIWYAMVSRRQTSRAMTIS